MDTICMKCGEKADNRVVASINDKDLPIIYLCYKHAQLAEEALQPQRHHCDVCHLFVKRAAEITVVRYRNELRNYCHACYDAWGDWQKQRYVDAKAAREPVPPQEVPSCRD